MQTDLNKAENQLTEANEQMQFIMLELKDKLKRFGQKPHEAVRELVLRVGALEHEQVEKGAEAAALLGGINSIFKFLKEARDNCGVPSKGEVEVDPL